MVTSGQHLKYGAGQLNSCFTYKVNPLNPPQDRLRCNDDSGTPTFQWINPIALTSSVVEDHVAFDLKDGERVAIGSRRPSGSADDEIRFHFPDAGGSPEPNFGIGVGTDVEGGSLPDLVSVSVSNGETLYGVWEAEASTELRVGRCPATEDCLQSTDWTITTVRTAATGGRINHPEFAHDGAFQMLVWEEDDDGDPGENLIYAMSRCGSAGTWSSPEVIRTPGSSTISQSLLFGSPHIVMNRTANVAHVAFVEIDTDNRTTATSTGRAKTTRTAHDRPRVDRGGRMFVRAHDPSTSAELRIRHQRRHRGRDVAHHRRS